MGPQERKMLLEAKERIDSLTARLREKNNGELKCQPTLTTTSSSH